MCPVRPMEALLQRPPTIVGWVWTLRANLVCGQIPLSAPKVSSGSNSADVVADQVPAQQLEVFGIGDELDETTRVAHAVCLWRWR